MGGSPRRNVRGDGARPSRRSLEDELHLAVAEALGDGHGIAEADLLAIHQVMDPMWKSLPKNAQGRVDRRLLRYIVHRYFMKRYSLSIIGLEPANVNSSHSEAALLMIHAPNYVKGVLEGKAATDGFNLEDAVGLAATLERLVSDTGRGIMEKAYLGKGKDMDSTLKRDEVHVILVDYLIHWMLGDDEESIEILVGNHSLLLETFADWPSVAAFADGKMRQLEVSRQFVPSMDIHAAYNPFAERFSFVDVESMVTDLTLEFGRFWENECQNIKELLIAMDRDNTGRVKLSEFYGTAMGGEWRFGESKDYLKQLGALDETSKWHGPRVIIPNYLQGANNCIVSASHYRVCCANECEGIMKDLEDTIGDPVASPEVILPIISNMSANLDDDHPSIDSSLVTQLQTIAEVSGSNQIPIHGRLFAQWLHYVFPRECPFPHKSGSTVSLSPLQFGDGFVATENEMEEHVENGVQYAGETEEEEAWMSQWSHEEELLTDYVDFEPSWVRKRSSTLVFAAVSACIGLALKLMKGSGGSPNPRRPFSDYGVKSHLV